MEKRERHEVLTRGPDRPRARDRDGAFFGEAVAPLSVFAQGYVRLLQMTVLPYITLSIIANLGTLTYRDARTLGVRAGGVLGLIWLTALVFACLVPLAFPAIESATFYSPSMAERTTPFDFVDLYIPSNPFYSLANNVVPALMGSCTRLIGDRVDPDGPTRDLPDSIIPTSFTFPHAGKILSISFILFAGWFSDSVVPIFKYPQLIVSGFFALFGSLNAAVPFLLDLFRIPADTFELFLATSVVNARFGTLVAATHTLAVGLLGSAAIAGKLRVQPARLLRFLVVTAALTGVAIVGLRTGFSMMLEQRTDGRSVVNALDPMATAENDTVIQPSDVPPESIPREDHVLEDLLVRGTLRVGLIDDGIPYEYRNDRNQVVGFDIEMAQSLAADLGVDAQFVRFPQAGLTQQVHARVVDIVMTGARVTPERAAEFATSEPYLDETLAIVVPDYRRRDFRSWEGIRQLGAVHLGVQNLPYYVSTVRRLVPNAQLTIIPESRELIDPSASCDAYVLPAERGSVLTMLNPRFSVVIPEGATVRMPLAYPIAGRDASWIRYVNTWIGLKKREGFTDELYAHWTLGRAAESKEPRWSIVRNVLHWVE